MKSYHPLITGLACALLGSAALTAEESIPEIDGLQKAAADFVVAYNNQDAAALAALFTEDGEMTDLSGTNLTSGHGEIEARYKQVFAAAPLHIAIEVDSIRIVAPGLAIEDGIYHLTPADEENAPARSTTYTAVLARNDSGEWRIASTRSLKDVSEGAGHLAGLAQALNGEWTHRAPDGVRLDLAFGWDSTGKHLIGEMLTTTADGEPQEGSIRIAWDASKQQILSWMFDAKGGFTHGIWTPNVQGWLVRSEGTTGDGEAIAASQQLTTDGPDTLIWSASQRVVDGQSLHDQTLRIVRQAPEPSAD
jgi:uncharacterized protein (TIGR02246 family)